MVVHSGLRWFMAVFYGSFVVVPWWFIVVHGGFSPKMFRKVM